MSTEHSNGYDLEYGPTPPGAKYEHTDIDPNVGYKFALWLTVAMVLSFGIVYGAFQFFEGREQAANAAAQKYPLAVDRVKEPPTPHLQTQPFKDIYTLRADEAAKLGSYGWVDKDGGVTHIPIDRAMEVLLQRGLPARAEGAESLNAVTQDASSGRTVAPR
ncbi:MAG TPA: hypothetical protein VEC39_17105 [Vicinamibacterales bacterium]|nr:hypothetical protein [Vicinamibacterales bacterium]